MCFFIIRLIADESRRDQPLYFLLVSFHSKKHSKLLVSDPRSILLNQTEVLVLCGSFA
jgi:hypothetical protein